MAFIGGDPRQFPPIGPTFQAPPTQFFPNQVPQGVPLSANQLPTLNFGAPGAPTQAAFFPQQGVGGFNPLLGPQVPGGGGAVFGGAPQGAQGFRDPMNMSTGDFFSTMLQMQFSTGDFISSAMGVSGSLSDANNPGSNLSIQQLGQQFQGIFGQMQQMEGQMVEQATETYKDMKEGLFADAHYEFPDGGEPKLVPGAETQAQKAQRLQFERRRQMAVEQQFARHPLSQAIQGLTQFINQATQTGQPVAGLMLQLDQMQTQLGMQKASALMQAQGPFVRGDQSDTANEAIRSVLGFGQGAIQDYGQMHAFNMQQLASNPITAMYFNAMAERTRRMTEAQQNMQRVSQQMLGMLGGGGGFAPQGFG